MHLAAAVSNSYGWQICNHGFSRLPDDWADCPSVEDQIRWLSVECGEILLYPKMSLYLITGIFLSGRCGEHGAMVLKFKLNRPILVYTLH